MLALGNCYASGRVIEFEILEKGDVSGYCEGAFFVVENEADWVCVWKRHTLIYESGRLPPSINFSVNVVVCAFMGRCPTTGYSIDVDRIWTDGEHVFVRVVKRDPPEGFAVGEMITYPYVLVVMEKTDLPIVFQIVNGNGELVEHVLVEFTSIALAIVLLTTVSLIVLVSKAKKPAKDESISHFCVVSKKWG